jgi:K+-transporting ATPase A subunit
MENKILDYQTMIIINSGLMTILIVLFTIVGWYFRKDWEESKNRISTVENHIDQMLLKMQSDSDREKSQMEMMRSMIAILARKTGTDIGL